MGFVGKVLGRVALGIGACTLAVYADYRIKGGPPIRQLYKTVKEERIKAEAEERARKLEHIVYKDGEFTVR